ncbi:MAG: aminotransferase class III-fold pyridoxal phosphate-dependent enzyme, partial [Gaiellales bacterium]
GRTGATLIEPNAAAAQPDIVCLGKALGCGYVASAVLARTKLAERAWERGGVEPAHTSTSIGDPVACAGILRSLVRIEHRGEQIEDSSLAWRECLEQLAADTRLELRGTGLLWALDTGAVGGGVELARRLLDEERMLVIPSGLEGSAITLYPAVICTDLERDRFSRSIHSVLV